MVMLRKFFWLVLLVVLGLMAAATVLTTAGAGVGFGAFAVGLRVPAAVRLLCSNSAVVGYLLLAVLHFSGHDEVVCCLYLLILLGHAWHFRAQLWGDVFHPLFEHWTVHSPCRQVTTFGRGLLGKVVAVAACL